MGHKGLYAPIENRLLMDWLKTKHDKKSARIAYLRMLGSDVQNNNGVFLTTTPSESDLKQRKTCDVTAANLSSITVYFSVRHCIESEWVNDRDQYQYPEASWEGDLEFQSDCLVYTLFHGQNRISALSGPNHWLPFTEQEVGAQEKFASHFMTDYISGKNRPATETTPDLFSQPQEASRANAAIRLPAVRKGSGSPRSGLFPDGNSLFRRDLSTFRMETSYISRKTATFTSSARNFAEKRLFTYKI